MIKVDFRFPSERDLTKMLAAVVEKEIEEKARRAASVFGGIRVRFKHKTDGSLDAVEFEGSDDAVRAARADVTG